MLAGVNCVVFLGKSLYFVCASLHPGVQMCTGGFSDGQRREVMGKGGDGGGGVGRGLVGYLNRNSNADITCKCMEYLIET